MAKVNPIQLQKHLKGVDYPASKQELIEHAKQLGADKDALVAAVAGSGVRNPRSCKQSGWRHRIAHQRLQPAIAVGFCPSSTK